jgi:hypothetical protein
MRFSLAEEHFDGMDTHTQAEAQRCAEAREPSDFAIVLMVARRNVILIYNTQPAAIEPALSVF